MQKYTPYTPMPSLGHELGIMFGFLGACLLTMALYTYFWRVSQRKNESQTLSNRRAFHARGGAIPSTDERSFSNNNNTHQQPMGATIGTGGPHRIHEKMVDRYAVPRGRVELPVHASDRGFGAEFGLRDTSQSRSQVHLGDTQGQREGRSIVDQDWRV